MKSNHTQLQKYLGKISVRNGLVGMLVIAIFTLVIYNMRDMLFGAPLVIHTEKDGATVSGQFVPLSGTALHATELLINGRPIGMDRDGSFDDGVILSPGYNIVELTQRDRFGKSRVETYHWFLEPEPAVAAAGAGASPAPYGKTTFIEAETIENLTP